MLVVTTDDSGLLVKPDVARRQLQAELQPRKPTTGRGIKGAAVPKAVQKAPRGGRDPTAGYNTAPNPSVSRTAVLIRRVSDRDTSRIADEVIAHLAGQVGAEVTVTIEIEAQLPNGATDQLVRTVTENSRTLKFKSHGFEAE